jgi:hypothetical protein
VINTIFLGDDNTSFCEMKSYKCISKVFGEILNLGQIDSIIKCTDLIVFLDVEEIRSRGDEYCDCLPPCSDTWYEPEISYASFPGRGFNRTSTYKRIEKKHKISPGMNIREYLK